MSSPDTKRLPGDSRFTRRLRHRDTMETGPRRPHGNAEQGAVIPPTPSPSLHPFSSSSSSSSSVQKKGGEESSSSLSLSSVLSWRRRRYDNRCHNNANTMATETTMTTISLVFFIGEAVDRWRCRRKGERGKRGKKRKRKRICGFHGEAEARISFPRRQKVGNDDIIINNTFM